jgi:murein DD-endopeptidase MepM/ murein hydrolase activator NlpD
MKPSSIIAVTAVGVGVLALIKRHMMSRGGSSKPVVPVTGKPLAIPSGRITSFGYRRREEHTHQGVDLGAPIGTPVYAMAPGVVTHASNVFLRGFSGYGRVVVVASPATATTPPIWYLYAHLDQALVPRGASVRAGQLIATVGSTCFNETDPSKACDGPHLHFETSPRPYPQDSEASRIDPAQVFAALEGQPQRGWRTT